KNTQNQPDVQIQQLTLPNEKPPLQSNPNHLINTTHILQNKPPTLPQTQNQIPKLPQLNQKLIQMQLPQVALTPK
ncbi:hypothetical protein, partial [Bacillus sp. WP8]|uniref:hypothetical protein n=1 Tax=Bacillus sp. WP8 TaxID=756828 RepID=UPI001C930F30